MADAGPNAKVEQQRLRANIFSQRATIEQQRLAILEMADRKSKHLENIAAAERAIAEMEKNLALMDEAHGELTPTEINKLSDSL